MKKQNKIDYILILKIFFLWLSVTAISIFIFAAVMYLMEGGYEFSPLFATISAAIGTFLSAMLLAKKIGKRGLLVGFCVGIAVFLILLLISLIANNSNLSINTLFRFIIIMLSALIGGVIGVNKNSSRKYI